MGTNIIRSLRKGSVQWNEEDPSWHRILFTVTDSSQMQVIAESVHCYLRVISTSVVMLLMRSW